MQRFQYLATTAGFRPEQAKAWAEQYPGLSESELISQFSNTVLAGWSSHQLNPITGDDDDGRASGVGPSWWRRLSTGVKAQSIYSRPLRPDPDQSGANLPPDEGYFDEAGKKYQYPADKVLGATSWAHDDAGTYSTTKRNPDGSLDTKGTGKRGIQQRLEKNPMLDVYFPGQDQSSTYESAILPGPAALHGQRATPAHGLLFFGGEPFGPGSGVFDRNLKFGYDDALIADSREPIKDYAKLVGAPPIERGQRAEWLPGREIYNPHFDTRITSVQQFDINDIGLPQDKLDALRARGIQYRYVATASREAGAEANAMAKGLDSKAALVGADTSQIFDQRGRSINPTYAAPIKDIQGAANAHFDLQWTRADTTRRNEIVNELRAFGYTGGTPTSISGIGPSLMRRFAAGLYFSTDTELRDDSRLSGLLQSIGVDPTSDAVRQFGERTNYDNFRARFTMASFSRVFHESERSYFAAAFKPGAPIEDVSAALNMPGMYRGTVETPGIELDLAKRFTWGYDWRKMVMPARSAEMLKDSDPDRYRHLLGLSINQRASYRNVATAAVANDLGGAHPLFKADSGSAAIYNPDVLALGGSKRAAGQRVFDVRGDVLKEVRSAYLEAQAIARQRAGVENVDAVPDAASAYEFFNLMRNRTATIDGQSVALGRAFMRWNVGEDNSVITPDFRSMNYHRAENSLPNEESGSLPIAMYRMIGQVVSDMPAGEAADQLRQRLSETASSGKFYSMQRALWYPSGEAEGLVAAHLSNPPEIASSPSMPGGVMGLTRQPDAGPQQSEIMQVTMTEDQMRRRAAVDPFYNPHRMGLSLTAMQAVGGDVDGDVMILNRMTGKNLRTERTPDGQIRVIDDSSGEEYTPEIVKNIIKHANLRAGEGAAVQNETAVTDGLGNRVTLPSRDAMQGMSMTGAMSKLFSAVGEAAANPIPDKELLAAYHDWANLRGSTGIAHNAFLRMAVPQNWEDNPTGYQSMERTFRIAFGYAQRPEKLPKLLDAIQTLGNGSFGYRPATETFNDPKTGKEITRSQNYGSVIGFSTAQGERVQPSGLKGALGVFDSALRIASDFVLAKPDEGPTLSAGGAARLISGRDEHIAPLERAIANYAQTVSGITGDDDAAMRARGTAYADLYTRALEIMPTHADRASGAIMGGVLPSMLARTVKNANAESRGAIDLEAITGMPSDVIDELGRKKTTADDYISSTGKEVIDPVERASKLSGLGYQQPGFDPELTADGLAITSQDYRRYLDERKSGQYESNALARRLFERTRTVRASDLNNVDDPVKIFNSLFQASWRDYAGPGAEYLPQREGGAGQPLDALRGQIAEGLIFNQMKQLYGDEIQPQVRTSGLVGDVPMVSIVDAMRREAGIGYEIKPDNPESSYYPQMSVELQQAGLNQIDLVRYRRSLAMSIEQRIGEMRGTPEGQKVLSGPVNEMLPHFANLFDYNRDVYSKSFYPENLMSPEELETKAMRFQDMQEGEIANVVAARRIQSQPQDESGKTYPELLNERADLRQRAIMSIAQQVDSGPEPAAAVTDPPAMSGPASVAEPGATSAPVNISIGNASEMGAAIAKALIDSGVAIGGGGGGTPPPADTTAAPEEPRRGRGISNGPAYKPFSGQVVENMAEALSVVDMYEGEYRRIVSGGPEGKADRNLMSSFEGALRTLGGIHSYSAPRGDGPANQIYQRAAFLMGSGRDPYMLGPMQNSVAQVGLNELEENLNLQRDARQQFFAPGGLNSAMTNLRKQLVGNGMDTTEGWRKLGPELGASAKLFIDNVKQYEDLLPDNDRLLAQRIGMAEDTRKKQLAGSLAPSDVDGASEALKRLKESAAGTADTVKNLGGRFSELVGQGGGVSDSEFGWLKAYRGQLTQGVKEIDALITRATPEEAAGLGEQRNQYMSQIADIDDVETARARRELAGGSRNFTRSGRVATAGRGMMDELVFGWTAFRMRMGWNLATGAQRGWQEEYMGDEQQLAQAAWRMGANASGTGMSPYLTAAARSANARIQLGEGAAQVTAPMAGMLSGIGSTGLGSAATILGNAAGVGLGAGYLTSALGGILTSANIGSGVGTAGLGAAITGGAAAAGLATAGLVGLGLGAAYISGEADQWYRQDNTYSRVWRQAARQGETMQGGGWLSGALAGVGGSIYYGASRLIGRTPEQIEGYVGDYNTSAMQRESGNYVPGTMGYDIDQLRRFSLERFGDATTTGSMSMLLSELGQIGGVSAQDLYDPQMVFGPRGPVPMRSSAANKALKLAGGYQSLLQAGVKPAELTQAAAETMQKAGVSLGESALDWMLQWQNIDRSKTAMYESAVDIGAQSFAMAGRVPGMADFDRIMRLQETGARPDQVKNMLIEAENVTLQLGVNRDTVLQRAEESGVQKMSPTEQKQWFQTQYGMSGLAAAYGFYSGTPLAGGIEARYANALPQTLTEQQQRVSIVQGVVGGYGYAPALVEKLAAQGITEGQTRAAAASDLGSYALNMPVGSPGGKVQSAIIEAAAKALGISGDNAIGSYLTMTANAVGGMADNLSLEELRERMAPGGAWAGPLGGIWKGTTSVAGARNQISAAEGRMGFGVATGYLAGTPDAAGVDALIANGNPLAVEQVIGAAGMASQTLANWGGSVSPMGAIGLRNMMADGMDTNFVRTGLGLLNSPLGYAFRQVDAGKQINLAGGGWRAGTYEWTPQFGYQSAFFAENYNREMEFGLAQTGMNVAGAQRNIAQFNLGRAYQLEQRGLNEQMIALNQSHQQSALGFQYARANLQFQQGMESWDMQNQMFQNNTAFQRQTFAIQAGRMPIQQQWQREDMAYSGNMAGLQYGWQQEDMQRNIRLASGRERQDMRRQQERQQVTYGMEQSQRSRERERFETQAGWQGEDLERQRQHFEEISNLQQRQQEMQKRHMIENHALTMAQLGAEAAKIGETAELQKKMREAQYKYEDKMAEYQKADLEDRLKLAQMQAENFKIEMAQKAELAKANSDYIADQIAAYAVDGKIRSGFAALIRWFEAEVARITGSNTNRGNTGAGKKEEDAKDSSKAAPMAAGGVVTRAVNAVIGEAGPEAVIPLAQLPKMVERMVEQQPRQPQVAQPVMVEVRLSPEQALELLASGVVRTSAFEQGLSRLERNRANRRM